MTSGQSTLPPRVEERGGRRTLARLLFPADAAARERRDRVLRVLFVLLGVVLMARAANKPVGVLVHNQEWGARFVAHQDPYFDPDAGHRMHGPYPPSLALMAAPLSLLPTLAARLTWSALQFVALIFFFRHLREMLRRFWPEVAPHASVLFGFALVLVSRYLLRDTAGGGGNLIYAALALTGVVNALRGRTVAAGLPLALSLAIKPNLWPLCLFLALRERWRALACTLVATAILFALPALYYGPRAYADLALRWTTDVVHYAQREDLHASALVPDGMPPAQDGMNQNIQEAVHRLLRPPGDSGAHDVHIVEVSPRAASWVARAVGLALLLVTALRARAAKDERAEYVTALAFFPLALMLSPVTWKAHHVNLLPALGVLAAFAAADARTRRWLAPLLWSYWLLCDLFSEEIIGASARNLLQAASIVTWMDIVLLGVLLVLAARPRERA